MDPEARSSGAGDEEVRPLLELAQALDDGHPDRLVAAIEDQVAIARRDIREAPFAARILSLLGKADLAFEVMERYLFDRGWFGQASPIGPMTRRYTDFLFSRPMATARADRRFTQLTRELGLADYWRARGLSLPSFPS